MSGNSEDSADPDKDSEFDSEGEDAVFRLYEQLYFEPNPDITSTDVKSTLSTEGEDGVEKSSQTISAEFAQKEAVTLDEGKNAPEMTNIDPPDTMSSTSSKIQDNQSFQFENCIFIDCPSEDSELPLPDSTSDLSLQATQKKSSAQQTAELNSTIHKIPICDDVPPMKRLLPSKSVRQRFPSSCSDGSIPGSVPLDGLYCTVVTTDEEEVGDERIKEKLIMKDLKANDHGKHGDNVKPEPRKRKRTNSSSDDEMEDSRCNNLISVASKISSRTSEACHLNEDSNSDGDVYVLPPPAEVNPQVFTLDSNPDSEPEVLAERVNKVRKQNNKYQKVEKAGISLLRKQGKVKRKSRKRGIGESESETDSSDVDFPESVKGTDLILNVDKSLSGLVKTVTKDSKAKSSTKPSPVKKAKKSLHDKSKRSSVDFTRGRPDTRTQPSCEKWTQSMANFYDSDISDDFDVSEVHQQQSGSQADWHLVPADYQITPRRRYYNAPERCKLCRQEGHTSKECSRVPKCHLCAGTSHRNRNDCPDNCCFKCGEEPHYFCRNTNYRRMCQVCGYPGHSKHMCPDLWRRFHVTTTGLAVQPPSEHYTKPPVERYCYVCAVRGHYGHECPLKYNNLAYSQVPQSVVSYSCPVISVNGYFDVNVEGAQAPAVEENMTKMAIKLDQTGKIIGRKGMVVKAISKESGAQVRVLKEGQPQVLLFGPSEARHKAQDIIEVLLGKKKSEKYVEFIEHLRTVNGSDSLDHRKSEKQSSTLAAGITSSTPTTSGYSGASASITTTTTTTDDNIPSVPDFIKMTTDIVTSGESCSTTAGGHENHQNTSWRESFLATLDRRKECVLKNVKEIMAFLVKDKCDVNISNSIRYLKQYNTRKKSKPVLKPNKALKRHMNKIAMTVIGIGKYGVDNTIYSEMKTLKKEVEVCPMKTIPENLCDKIAKTLECLHDPSVDKINQLIKYGKKYRNSYIKNKSLLKKSKQKVHATSNKVKQNENTENESTGKVLSKRAQKKKYKKLCRKLKQQYKNAPSGKDKKSNVEIKK